MENFVPDDKYTRPPKWLLSLVDKFTEEALSNTQRTTGRKPSCGNAAVARRLGVAILTVERIRRGEWIKPRTLNMIKHNCIDKDGDALRIRLREMLKPIGPQRWRMRAYMQSLAKIVQDYRKQFKLTSKVKFLYVFPPRSVIREMSLAIDHVYRLLKEIHSRCPEFDDIVFADAPELLTELKASDKPKRKTAASTKKKKTQPPAEPPAKPSALT